MPADELAALDERLVTDGAFYEELLVVEDELVDQYLNDELSADERERFEKHFLLTPDRHQKLRFANTFNRYLNAAEPRPVSIQDMEDAREPTADVAKPPPKKWYSFLPQNPVLAYSLAAAVVLIVAGISWLAWQNTKNPTAGELVAVTLTPGTTRSEGEIQRISIPPGTGTVELRLSLTKSDYIRYRAVVLGEARSPVWTGDNLQAETASGSVFVEVKVPAQSLPPGDYQVKLSGQLTDGAFEDLPSYRFKVSR